MSEEFLMHYGVKGMRWGVITKGRKKGRRRSKQNDDSMPVMNNEFYAQGRYYPSKGVLPKGSAIYRITRNPSKDELSGGKLRYVSHTTKDNYSWYNHLSELYKGQKLYANTYKTVTNIKIADMYALNDAARKFLPEEKAYEKAVKELRTKDLIHDDFEERTYRSLSTNPYGPSYLASKGMPGNTSLAKKTIQELERQGYGGVTDPIGFDIAEDPLILFDPKKKLKLVEHL